jgi:hypothetical protein
MIMFSSAAIISGYTSFSTTYPCAQIGFTLGEEGTSAAFPDCVMYYNGTNPEQRVVVYPNMDSENPIEIAAALGISFGTAGWLALWIHAILIEFYVRTSPSPQHFTHCCALTDNEIAASDTGGNNSSPPGLLRAPARAWLQSSWQRRSSSRTLR